MDFEYLITRNLIKNMSIFLKQEFAPCLLTYSEEHQQFKIVKTGISDVFNTEEIKLLKKYLSPFHRQNFLAYYVIHITNLFRKTIVYRANSIVDLYYQNFSNEEKEKLHKKVLEILGRTELTAKNEITKDIKVTSLLLLSSNNRAENVYDCKLSIEVNNFRDVLAEYVVQNKSSNIRQFIEHYTDDASALVTNWHGVNDSLVEFSGTLENNVFQAQYFENVAVAVEFESSLYDLLELERNREPFTTKRTDKIGLVDIENDLQTDMSIKIPHQATHKSVTVHSVKLRD